MTARPTRSVAALGGVLMLVAAVHGAAARDAACTLRSRYDVTVMDEVLVFERAAAPAQRIEMSRGRLTVDGATVPLSAGDRDRVVSFESTARALVPPVKALAQRGVDVGVAAIREEAAATSPKAAANPKLNARLDARAQNLKGRIAASNTSKEWRGAAVNRYLEEAMGDVLPLIGGDLAQQAVDVAMHGDLAAAVALKEKAERIRPSLEARVRARLDTLQPEIDRLCPSLRSLDALEAGITAALPGGSRLNLVEIGR